MKKHIVVFLACALASVASVYAQDALRVDIPFEFTVGNATLPAGEYIIRSPRPGMVMILGKDNFGSAIGTGLLANRAVISEVITKWQPGASNTAPNARNPKNNKNSTVDSMGENCAVFNKYGDAYFLREIWTGYSGIQMFKGKNERAIQTAGTFRLEKRVELAALVR